MSRKPRQIPPESQTVEWKQSLGEWKEIVETCAAFATSDGGTIYVGIAPRGERIGVQLGQGTLEDLANKIKVNTDPPQFPSIAVEGPDSSAIVQVRVEPNPVKPVWAFGRPVKRVGRTNQFLRRDEAQRLLETTTGGQSGSGIESGIESELAVKVIQALGPQSLSMKELAIAVGWKRPNRYLHKLVNLLLSSTIIERTIPDKPNSRLQQYRLTEKGRSILRQVTG